MSSFFLKSPSWKRLWQLICNKIRFFSLSIHRKLIEQLSSVINAATQHRCVDVTSSNLIGWRNRWTVRCPVAAADVIVKASRKVLQYLNMKIHTTAHAGGSNDWDRRTVWNYFISLHKQTLVTTSLWFRLFQPEKALQALVAHHCRVDTQQWVWGLNLAQQLWLLAPASSVGIWVPLGIVWSLFHLCPPGVILVTMGVYKCGCLWVLGVVVVTCLTLISQMFVQTGIIDIYKLTEAWDFHVFLLH